MHNALRIAGGAAGEEQCGHVLRLALCDLVVEQRSIGRIVGLACGDQCVERIESGLAVVAQAARIVVPDSPEHRAARAHFDHLVDLLLILDHGVADFRILDREHVFGGHRVLIQRHRHGAERLRSEHRGIQAWPVLADHHQVIAAFHAGVRHAARQPSHQQRELGPGGGLPDPVLLFA
jgi:hypothetical protein